MMTGENITRHGIVTRQHYATGRRHTTLEHNMSNGDGERNSLIIMLASDGFGDSGCIIAINGERRR